MVHIHRDKICSVCNSVNEDEFITKEKDTNTTEMIVRCKCCGHEYIQGVVTVWNDPDCPKSTFKITGGQDFTQEIY